MLKQGDHFVCLSDTVILMQEAKKRLYYLNRIFRVESFTIAVECD